MEYLVLVHVLFAILWAGGAVSSGLFIIPSVLDAGPGGGAVMVSVNRRKYPVFLTVSAAVVVLSGLRLYMVRFSAAWLTSPEGIVLTLGALLGLAAFGIGVFVQKPTAQRLGALSAQLAASGTPPTPAQAAELQALRTRLAVIGRVLAWHLIGAALLMASHRLATAF
jgi:uncharacterized membrane protein